MSIVLILLSTISAISWSNKWKLPLISQETVSASFCPPSWCCLQSAYAEDFGIFQVFVAEFSCGWLMQIYHSDGTVSTVFQEH